jgi:hypothetical protein
MGKQEEEKEVPMLRHRRWLYSYNLFLRVKMLPVTSQSPVLPIRVSSVQIRGW